MSDVNPVMQLMKILTELENPIGHRVNLIILTLFVVALAELTIAVMRIAVQAMVLRRARKAFGGLSAPFPNDVEEMLEKLRLKRSRALVAQRVRNLFQLRSKGLVDPTVVKEITGEQVALLGGFSRFVAGSLTVLGLIGTVLGLSLALRELPSLAGQAERARDLDVFRNQMMQTLGGMQTAFSCTLAGLLSSLVLSLLAFVVQRAQFAFTIRLESFSNYELVPAIIPTDSDRAAGRFVESVEHAGTSIAAALKVTSEASQRYVEGTGAVVAAGTALGEQAKSLGDGMSEVRTAVTALKDAASHFANVAQSVVDANAKQVDRWDAVGKELKGTASSLLEQSVQLGRTASTMQEGAAGLRGVAELPANLQSVLAEAMRLAVESAQARQDVLTTAYVGKLDEFLRGFATRQAEFHEGYVDLVMGVQAAVGDALRSAATGASAPDRSAWQRGASGPVPTVGFGPQPSAAANRPNGHEGSPESASSGQPATAGTSRPLDGGRGGDR